jgi:hypothetical protein
MGRLLASSLAGEIVDPDWSPLDTAEAPEYVPLVWRGWHVGLRLVEAFRTLARMPTGAPGGHKTMWPLYQYEVREYYAALIGADSEIAADVQGARNRVRLQASAEDIQRMETALSWPAHFLGANRLLCIVVNEVAFFRARGFDLDRIARKTKPRCSTNLLRHRNQLGLDQIAEGLRREEAPVF